MKKYLINGALALLAGFNLASCSEKESDFVPVAEQKVRAFEEVFKEVYGEIDPHQRWGFTDVMIMANGDSVEATLIEDTVENVNTRPFQMAARAFTRATMPTEPTFRDTNPITKPTMPSYSNTVPSTAHYAKDYQNYQKGDVIYINSAYSSLNNPQNTEDLTIYVDGNVSYYGSTNQNGNGTVFCVTNGSTLKLGSVSNNLTVYLAPNAKLDISQRLDGNGNQVYDVIYPDWNNYQAYSVKATTFSFQNNHAAIYMSAGSQVTAADLQLVNGVKVLNSGGTITADNITLDEKSILWNEGTITVENNMTITNTNSMFYNAQNKTVTVKGNLDLINNDALLYNEGTVNVTSAIVLHNKDAEIVNNGTLTGASFSSAAGGKMHNVGTTTISGKTDLSNSNSKWMNDGQYTSGTFDVDNYSKQNYNNCRLTVNGRFFLNRGEFVLNSNASVICNSFTWEDTSNFFLGGKSMLKVNGKLLTNNYNSNYGFRGYGDDYAVIMADEIAKGKGDVQFSMSYYGKLYIATDKHFAQGALDPANNPPAQPYYYYESTVKFKFEGDGCPVTIPVTPCNPGIERDPVISSNTSSSETTTVVDEWDQVTSQSGRVFCEDLGKAAREDLDYNDVVFDVIIWANRKKSTTTTTTTTTTYTDGVQTGQTSSSQTSDPSYTDWTYFAQIKLLAAGGTIPLTVAGYEVHNAFGVGVTTMVNTRDGNSTAFGSYVDKDPVSIGNVQKSFKFDGKSYDLTLIEGIEKAQDVTIVSSFNNAQVAELGADVGKAPHKLFVPMQTQWTSERKPLNLAYPNFANYVSDATKSWVKNPDDYYLYSVQHKGLETMPLVMKTKKVTDSETMDVLSDKEYDYTKSSWSLNGIFLNTDKFWPGDRIRFYGSGINGDSYITVVFADNSKPYFVDTKFAESDKNGNYPQFAFVEVLLDEYYCDKLNNSKKDDKIMIVVQGRAFKLTKITRVPFK